MRRTIATINKKIHNGTVRVVTADRMTELVRRLGADQAAEQVDVVTTGTFGAMCSSGAWINLGHADPPIKISRLFLNDVEAYSGVAAVDAYIGATQPSRSRGISYGGGHVIEDLVNGRPVTVRAVAYGTDCYPRKRVLTRLRLADLNQAVMNNPRNAYQRYAAAINGSERPLRTYMGVLNPGYANITYSGAGALSPVSNDPEFRTIGIGSRVFLGGGTGYISGSGTQHLPEKGFATLMVQGNLKKMSGRFLRGASFNGYGSSLYVGLGIPIPVLNPQIAAATGVGDDDIITEIIDYSVSSGSRPTVKQVSYAQLKSGSVTINGHDVPTAPLSSFFMAKQVAETLKQWIERGQFLLSQPVERLDSNGSAHGMVRQRKEGVHSTHAGGIENPKSCIHCGQCGAHCPHGAISRATDLKIHRDQQVCGQCDSCVAICPLGHLTAAKKPEAL